MSSVLEHDPDDPPPQVGYADLHWWFLNRWAEWSMRFARMFVLLGIVIAFFAVTQARAHDLEEVASVMCNTEIQAAKFVELGADPKAARKVNADENRVTCALAEVRYIRGRTVSIHNSPVGLVEVVEILVVAVRFRGMWGEVAAGLQYAVFELKGQGA